ncbi:MAG: rhomboid family intramembrane serine protease, partial [Chloroflexota bacterium]|nr:rhomboid family intramembrane serine protease [Chloroflexota bacterium]
MIPVYDSVRSRSFPIVNVTIILINFIVFFYEIALSQQQLGLRTSELDRFIFHWGNIPACTFDALGRNLAEARSATCLQQPDARWTILAAMFMHGGWLHILGNMLFLWIFGDNVEDAMGHARYAIFYLLVGTLAAFAHMFVNPHDLTPAIGASGAIAGVMGAYIVLFPRATVAVIIPIFFFIPFPLPAFVLIGFWFVAQIFSGFASLGPNAVGAGGGVAYFAHVGGFIAGAVLVNLFVLG